MSEKRSIKANLLIKLKTRKQIEDVCKELGLPSKGSREVLYSNLESTSCSKLKVAINKVISNE